MRLHATDIEFRHAGADAPAIRLGEFELAPGQHLAVVGPSGCGKSTLVQLLAGLLKPQVGKILAGDTELSALSGSSVDTFRGRHFGMIFQGLRLFPALTALENVLLGLRFSSGVSRCGHRDVATSMLDRVGLAGHEARLPGRLSMGQQQRVAVARALAHSPSILIADEPTAALDPDNGIKVFDLMRTLCTENGCSLLMITHDQALAERLPGRFDATRLIQPDR